jgi:hypothetical protein
MTRMLRIKTDFFLNQWKSIKSAVKNSAEIFTFFMSFVWKNDMHCSNSTTQKYLDEKQEETRYVK